MSLLVYHKVIPYTKFENFGIIRFLVKLWTNKQTDRLENPTHADWQIDPMTDATEQRSLDH